MPARHLRPGTTPSQRCGGSLAGLCRALSGRGFPADLGNLCRSKSKQDKGRGSERPSGQATPPRNAAREAGLRDFHCGDHRWSVDPRLAVTGGRINTQTRIVAGFSESTRGGHLGGLWRYFWELNFYFIEPYKIRPFYGEKEASGCRRKRRTGKPCGIPGCWERTSRRKSPCRSFPPGRSFPCFRIQSSGSTRAGWCANGRW